MGVDLSLRATGIIVVPVRWGLDWARILCANRVGRGLPLHASQREKYVRIDGIAHTVLERAKQFRCSAVAIEDYAFSRDGAHAHELGELGGVVKRELFASGFDVCVYHASTARKLLGRAPRKQQKDWAHARLRAADAPALWAGDILDAFLQANNHLSLTGGDALVIPEAA